MCCGGTGGTEDAEEWSTLLSRGRESATGMEQLAMKRIDVRVVDKRSLRLRVPVDESYEWMKEGTTYPSVRSFLQSELHPAWQSPASEASLEAAHSPPRRDLGSPHSTALR
mgnify:FL=1